MASITIATATSGTNTLLAAPGVGKKIRVKGIYLQFRDNQDFYIQSGTSGTFHVGNSTVKCAGAAAGGFVLPPVTLFWFDCDENKALVLNLSTTDGAAGLLIYEEVRV